jgi:hypothetical protein
MIFFYLGMCTMLPWNFLISITAFWNYKFREVNATSPFHLSNYTAELVNFPIPLPIIKPTEMQLSFPSYVAIASNIPGAITTLLHSGLGQRVRYLKR